MVRFAPAAGSRAILLGVGLQPRSAKSIDLVQPAVGRSDHDLLSYRRGISVSQDQKNDTHQKVYRDASQGLAWDRPDLQFGK